MDSPEMFTINKINVYNKCLQFKVYLGYVFIKEANSETLQCIINEAFSEKSKQVFTILRRST